MGLIELQKWMGADVFDVSVWNVDGLIFNIAPLSWFLAVTTSPTLSSCWRKQWPSGDRQRSDWWLKCAWYFVSKLIGLYKVPRLLFLSFLCKDSDNGSFFHASRNDGDRLKGVHKSGTSEIGKCDMLKESACSNFKGGNLRIISWALC